MVKLTLKREIRSDKSTISRLSVEECGRLCDILEPVDRGLRKDMSLAEIKKLKVAGATAIPTGEYEVTLAVSPTFKDKYYAKKYGGRFPLIKDVPGFSGVLIHPGNSPKDTKACQLPGVYDAGRPDYVRDSVMAFQDLMDFYIWPAFLRKDKITLKIE